MAPSVVTKAQWVLRGFSQQLGVDYEALSPVVKPATTILSMAFSRDWPIHQLDMKNAFLHGHMEDTIYYQQSFDSVDPIARDHVCLLEHSLYGLQQALGAWYQHFATYLRFLGFIASVFDMSLFVYKDGDRVAYLPLPVDDIVLTVSSMAILQRIIERLHAQHLRHVFAQWPIL
jgi:hypothetical protein